MRESSRVVHAVGLAPARGQARQAGTKGAKRSQRRRARCSPRVHVKARALLPDVTAMTGTTATTAITALTTMTTAITAMITASASG